jgi:hypothetical protein
MQSMLLNHENQCDTSQYYQLSSLFCAINYHRLDSKKTLSERDICTKYITPALQRAGWNIETQVLEEVSFTDGKIFVEVSLQQEEKERERLYSLLQFQPGCNY